MGNVWGDPLLSRSATHQRPRRWDRQLSRPDTPPIGHPSADASRRRRASGPRQPPPLHASPAGATPSAQVCSPASATGTNPSPHSARRTHERDVPSRTDVALPPARPGWRSRLRLTPHPRAIQRSRRGARTRLSVDEGGRARPVTPRISDRKRDAPSGDDAEKLSGTKKCRVAAPR